MNLVEIDMGEVAQTLIGRPAAHQGTIAIAPGTILHRFDDDALHIIVDGCGNYSAVQNPRTSSEVFLKDGHLSEFRQPT